MAQDKYTLSASKAKTPQMTAREQRYYDMYGAKRTAGTANQDGFKYYSSLVNKYNLNPHITKDEKRYYDMYGKKIYDATNNLNGLDYYNKIAKRYNLNPTKTHTTYLRQMSQKALGGDKDAAAYLKAMNYKPLDKKSNLWYNFDEKNLAGNNQLATAYRKDNPYSDNAKAYDMNHYEKYNDMITDNKPMTADQLEWYNKAVKKWNMDDMNNPFTKQKHELQDLEKQQLNAQDQALNNAMVQMDGNNFQKFQALQQDMSTRGMGDSGIAQDAYARMQMASNRDYQDAFVQATQNKANIQNGMFEQRVQLGERERDQQNKDAALKQQQQTLDLQKQQLINEQVSAQQKAQADQDKWLTEQAGYIYVGGKQLKSGGKPIPTVEWYKMTETQRHNIATENNASLKLQYDYLLGSDANAIKRESNAITREGNQLDYQLGMQEDATRQQKIAADLQTKMAQIEYDYKSLDFKYSELESLNKYRAEKVKEAADNAQNTKDKEKLLNLNKMAERHQKSITNLQKKKNPTSKDEKAIQAHLDKLNEYNNEITDMIGGMPMKESNPYMGYAGGDFEGLIP